MELSDRFESVCSALGVGHASADFYPYSELKHTWKRRGDSVTFKISDYLNGAPEEVLDSLAWHLVSMAFGRKCSPERSEGYLQYSHSQELWRRVESEYLKRARALDLGPSGAHRDLRAVFDYVNSSYFGGGIPNAILAWVTESPSRRLGFYFTPLNLLAVNKVFDSDRVPRFALEFVMYHELLHHVDAVNGRPRRRVHHTKSFREQERLFSSYSEANTWLRRLARAKQGNEKKGPVSPGRNSAVHSMRTHSRRPDPPGGCVARRVVPYTRSGVSPQVRRGTH